LNKNPHDVNLEPFLCILRLNISRVCTKQIEVNFMKNISKWLLAGSVLAVAFACQPKKPTNPAEQNSPQKNQNSGGCNQSAKEKSVPKPAAEVQKPAAQAAQSAPVVQPVVTEKKAAPTPALPTAERSATPAPTERAVSSPAAAESKLAPVSAAPTPEIKGETSVQTAAPVVSDNQPALSDSGK
jgi:hypothetical protein